MYLKNAKILHSLLFHHSHQGTGLFHLVLMPAFAAGHLRPVMLYNKTEREKGGLTLIK